MKKLLESLPQWTGSLDDDAPLPRGTKTQTGVLPESGLTYYWRKNDEPRDRVELVIAVRAGSIDETDDERGLAHVLEHHGFPGAQRGGRTRFSALRELEAHGVSFGAHQNASHVLRGDGLFLTCRRTSSGGRWSCWRRWSARRRRSTRPTSTRSARSCARRTGPAKYRAASQPLSRYSIAAQAGATSATRSRARRSRRASPSATSRSCARPGPRRSEGLRAATRPTPGHCVEIKIYGAFVLNHRVVLHASARRGCPMRSRSTSRPVHPTNWLISHRLCAARCPAVQARPARRAFAPYLRKGAARPWPARRRFPDLASAPPCLRAAAPRPRERPRTPRRRRPSPPCPWPSATRPRRRSADSGGGSLVTRQNVEPPAREARHGERAAVQLGVRRRAAARRAAARRRWHPGRDRQHAERRAPGPRPRRRRFAERVARRRREARPRHGGRAAHGAARDPGRPADAVEGTGPDRVVVAGRRGAGPLPARGAVRRRPRRGRARGGFAADRHRRGRPRGDRGHVPRGEPRRRRRGDAARAGLRWPWQAPHARGGARGRARTLLDDAAGGAVAATGLRRRRFFAPPTGERCRDKPAPASAERPRGAGALAGQRRHGHLRATDFKDDEVVLFGARPAACRGSAGAARGRETGDERAAARASPAPRRRRRAAALNDALGGRRVALGADIDAYRRIVGDCTADEVETLFGLLARLFANIRSAARPRRGPTSTRAATPCESGSATPARASRRSATSS